MRGRPPNRNRQHPTPDIDTGKTVVDTGNATESNGTDETVDVGNTDNSSVAESAEPERINGIPIIDPDSGTGEQPKRRGRPPGSGNNGTGERRTYSKKGTKDLSGLETLLLETHSLLAGVTGAPEFELTEDESKKLIKSYDTLSAFYPHTSLDPKLLAWINMMTVIGSVYGSRFVAYRTRTADDRKTRTIHKVTPQVKPVVTHDAPAVQADNMTPSMFNSRPPRI